MAKIVSGLKIPSFPTHIQIQTTTACAYRCRYCPQGLRARTRRRLMDQGMFNVIANELGRYPPKHISPYLMSDPLTDPQIFLRIDLLRAKCPDTFIELSTTPELITAGRIPHLVASPFSELRISMPTLDSKLYAALREGASAQKAIERITALLTAIRNSGRELRITIVLLENIVSPNDFNRSLEFWKKNVSRVVSWPITSRAGNVTSIQHTRNKELKGCSQGRATNWFHIAWDGSVVLCCMDYDRKVDIGTLRQRSIKEIWTSSQYRRVRGIAIGEVDHPQGDFPCVTCEWAGPYLAGATRYTASDSKKSQRLLGDWTV